MKRMKRWTLALLTLLLTGIGAGMPWAAARFQDLYGIAAQEVLPLDAVSLTLRQDSEIGAVLRLMSAPYDSTEWPGETRLTEEEARSAALDALVMLDQYELLESGYMGQYGDIEPGVLERLKASGGSNASPALFLSLDGTTAIIWYCHWKPNTGPSYELLVDDATGLAVIGYIPCPPVAEPEMAYLRMERWLSFFQDYYGAEITDIDDQSYGDIPRFIFHIDPGDGQGELGIIVRMYHFETDFNPCSAEVFGIPLPEDSNAAVGPYVSNY